MKEVFIKYNPYKVKIEIKINEKELPKDSRLQYHLGKRLQLWLDKLIEGLLDEINRNEFKILFYGRKVDFADLQEIVMKYNQREDKNIIIEHQPIKGDSELDKIKRLKELSNYMKDSPFEDLRSSKLQKKFKKAIESQFEVALIATMSAGKSTLLNSLLGQELMPSKNRACTATIVKIKDNDESNEFKGKVFDKDENLLEKINDLDKEKMSKLNENPEVDYIELEGDIPLISSEKTSLEIIDTPGPNSSNNPDHKVKTYRVIKKEAKPVILYVLDVTSLATNDDANLLKAVAEQMKVGDKQSKDRFIFALNKIDDLDEENEEFVEDYIKEAEKYLKKQGINNPNIYPISAELAKVIRMKINQLKLTRRQKNKLKFDSEYFNDVEDKHLIQYSPLNKLRKDVLIQKVNEARDKEDIYKEALYHSGVPSIEVAINEYLDKYTLPLNIKDAIEPVLNIIKAEQWKDKLQNRIKENDILRKKLNKKIDIIKEKINKGEEAREFKDKIRNLNNSKNKVDETIESITIKIEKRTNEIRRKFKNRDIKPYQAKNIIKKVKDEVTDLKADIYTDLEKMKEEVLKNEGERLINEYKKYLEDLVQFDKNDFQWNDFSYITVNLPDNNELISNCKRKQKIKRNPEGIWENIQSFFGKEFFDKKEVINEIKLVKELLLKASESLYPNVQYARKNLKEDSEKLKSYFLAQINKLNKVIENKMNELRELSSSQKEIKKSIEKDKENIEWLNDFSKKIYNILEI
ncbi:dynamin family protein [Natroniella acetigena]|uniref:dynamin family protein n=1 Tax=Natroniella acetigena TaxID=52004 RepID=UPI00200A8123|nr:dynamin family protein [Natroniella acetigena]MCK8827927.1 dynamin family protein [Natroniella acetigena]